VVGIEGHRHHLLGEVEHGGLQLLEALGVFQKSMFDA
jgi:hypothetical protein